MKEGQGRVVVWGEGGTFSSSFVSDLPVNLLKFLLEIITVHEGRETHLNRSLNFFFLFSEGCGAEHVVLDMKHKVESFGLEYVGQ